MKNSTLWGLSLYVIIGIIIWVIAGIIWKKKEKRLPIKDSFNNTLYRHKMYNEYSAKTRVAILIWCIGLEAFALYICVGVSREIFIPPISFVIIIIILFIAMDIILVIKDIFNIHKSKKL